MVAVSDRRRKGETGQAVVLVTLAISIFLLAAVGLAVDASQLYAQRQMSQTVADAAAQAGIVSIFNGSSAIGTSAYYCTSSNSTSPCTYVVKNGFSTTNTTTGSCTAATGSDCIRVDPNPGVAVANLDPQTPNELQVTITRSVGMTLTKMLPGISTFNVTARATAAIVDVISPIPIIITHPTMAGALDMNGNTGIVICGGPQRSIQVNSNGTNPSGNALVPPSSGAVDLSKPSPPCPTGQVGGDFANNGGPITKPATVNVTNGGHYIDPASPILDPLANIYPSGPPAPTTTPPQNGQACSVLGHCSNCPAPGFTGAAPLTCTEYLPGLYTSLDLSGVNSAFFDPGLYYVQGGGFKLKNTTVQMCSTCTPDTNTSAGMVVYDTGSTSSPTATGGFQIDTNVNAILWGAGVSASNLTAPPSAPYYGILFFENRQADAHTGSSAHGLGTGNGCFSLVGTVYIHNLLSIMLASPSHYQAVKYNGGPCSSTQNNGEIIVNQLKVVGGSSISMNLAATAMTAVRQLALVNGE